MKTPLLAALALAACTPMQTPPPTTPHPVVRPGIEVFLANPPAAVRQRMGRHRADPACAGCPARMDPLGFALENFDGIGKWRDREGPSPIDASGILPVRRAQFTPQALLPTPIAESSEERPFIVG
jgi:hypothetical protein